MKKDRVINPDIIREIAAIGHTEYFVIADCGLPIPKGCKLVDVSVTAGLPRFMDVLKAVDSELVVESAIIASEIDSVNPSMRDSITEELAGVPIARVTHAEFKELTKAAKCIVRTGETSSYSNVILIAGVNF